MKFLILDLEGLSKVHVLTTSFYKGAHTYTSNKKEAGVFENDLRMPIFSRT